MVHRSLVAVVVSAAGQRVAHFGIACLLAKLTVFKKALDDLDKDSMDFKLTKSVEMDGFSDSREKTDHSIENGIPEKKQQLEQLLSFVYGVRPEGTVSAWNWRCPLIIWLKFFPVFFMEAGLLLK